MFKRIISIIFSITLLLNMMFQISVYGDESDDIIEVDLYGDEENSNARRYTVLVLDISGPQTFKEEPNYMNIWGTEYTSDSSIESVKKAAGQFLENARKAIGKNYIALITYSTEAHILSGFTEDIDELEKLLDNIEYEDANRSIHAGLECAYGLLNEITDEKAIKNLLLCTTGLTDEGEYNYDGWYGSDTIASDWHNLGTGIHLYAYANAAIESADKIKNMGVNLYVIGLFDPIEENMPSTSGLKAVTQFLRMTARDIASSEFTFFAVHDLESLEFSFGKLEEDLTGTSKVRIYFKLDDSENKSDAEYDWEGGSLKLGGRYEEMRWGPVLFETPSNELFMSKISSANPEESVDTVNWNLAMLCGCLSAASYNADYMVQAYKDLGFSDDNIFLYSYPDSEWNRTEAEKDGKKGFAQDNDLAFSIASKPMSINGKKTEVIVVTLRGTSTDYEKYKDGTMSLTKDFYGCYVWDWVRDFKDDVIAGIIDYLSEHEDINSRPVKILITGHSLGGGAANLVAADLNIRINLTMNRQDNDESSDNVKIYPEDIYAYTFGAIDSIVGKVENDPEYSISIPISEGFENIINIYNFLDTFSPLASLSGDFLTALGQMIMCNRESIIGKFGVFYFFADDMKKYVPEDCAYITHSMGGYIQAVKNNLLYNQQYSGNKIRVLICCPVDVKIICENEEVCIIENEEVVYLAPEVSASICEGEKAIILPADMDYQVKINATDNGTMFYSVQNLDTGNPESISFNGIELTQGKNIEGDISKEISDETIDLFSVDLAGERLTEIANDGTEMEIIKEPELTPEIKPAEDSPTPSATPIPEIDVSEETPIILPDEEKTAEDKEDKITEREKSNGLDSVMIPALVTTGVIVVLTASIILLIVLKNKKINRE